LQGCLDDLVIEPSGLDIQLNAVDSSRVPQTVKSHIAEVDLLADDFWCVEKLDLPLPVTNPIEMPATLCRHAGIHQREAAAAAGRHRRRSIRVEDVAMMRTV